MDVHGLYRIAFAGYAVLFVAFVLCCMFVSGNARDLVLYGGPTVILVFTLVLAYIYMRDFRTIEVENEAADVLAADDWEKPKQ